MFWGCPWSDSLGCPPIALTILFLLPLPTLVAPRFPPKPSPLYSLLFLHRRSYWFSWFQCCLGTLKSSSPLPNSFLNSNDKFLTGAPLGSLLVLQHGHTHAQVHTHALTHAAYLCWVQLWGYYILLQISSLAPSDSCNTPYSGLGTSTVKLYSSPSDTHQHCLQGSLWFGKTPLLAIPQTCFPACPAGNCCFLPVMCPTKRVICTRKGSYKSTPLTHFTNEKDTQARGWDLKVPEFIGYRLSGRGPLAHRSRCFLWAAHWSHFRANLIYKWICFHKVGRISQAGKALSCRHHGRMGKKADPRSMFALPCPRVQKEKPFASGTTSFEKMDSDPMTFQWVKMDIQRQLSS